MEIRVWRFQNYRDCGYTCNPHKFEIPALRFPCRVPVIPCKHLQCNETLSISGGAVGPGLFFIIPCMDTIVVTDLRTVSFDVPPQEILTKDSVTVAVDAVVYFKISNPMAAVCNVNNAPQATKLLASTTLRNTLGTKTLSEILADREQIAQHMLGSLDHATDPWGVKV